MLDYCGEEEFYPMDGDNDNYNTYTPNIEGVEFIRNLQRKLSSTFVPDSGYYDGWKSFDRVIERATCYSILMHDVWMNIPKKIVRKLTDKQMLVYLPIFTDIYLKATEKAHDIGE